MKNWRTTLLGASAAALLAAQTFISEGFTGSKEQIAQLIVAVAMAALGAFSKDFNVSGK
jgi:hypothetical protein